MIAAEPIKTIPVTLPNGTISYIDIFVDPRTDLLFALDSTFVEQVGDHEIQSPFNPHAKIRITSI